MDMAEKIGIALNNYSKIERGITELSIKRLEQIAEIFSVTLAELLGIEVKNDYFVEVESLKLILDQSEIKYDSLKSRMVLIEKNFTENLTVCFNEIIQKSGSYKYDFVKKCFVLNDDEIKTLFDNLIKTYIDPTDVDSVYRILVFTCLSSGVCDSRFKELWKNWDGKIED